MNKDNPPPTVIYLGVEGVNSTYSPESGLPMFRYGIRNQLTWFNSTWLKADPSHGLAKYFGPSGVRALSLAAGINKGGHYFRYIFLFFFLLPLFKTTEEVVVGFKIFA